MKKEKKQSNSMGWLLLILLICMTLGLNYVKFFMNTENENIEETPVENSASQAITNALNDIVTNFNSNEKIKTYEEQGIKMNAVLKNHSIYISYQTDTTITYEFNYNNLNLTITIENEEENIKKFKQVYEILIHAAQARLKNEENIDSLVTSFLDDTREYNGLTKTVDSEGITYKMNFTIKLTENNTEEATDSTQPTQETEATDSTTTTNQTTDTATNTNQTT